MVKLSCDCKPLSPSFTDCSSAGIFLGFLLQIVNIFFGDSYSVHRRSTGRIYHLIMYFLGLIPLPSKLSPLHFFTGEVSRDRGSKHRVLLTVSSSITSLHIRHNTRATHLFVTTKNNIFCINCTARDKETTVSFLNTCL